MTVTKDESGREGADDDGDMPGGGDGYVPSQRRLERERHKRDDHQPVASHVVSQPSAGARRVGK